MLFNNVNSKYLFIFLPPCALLQSFSLCSSPQLQLGSHALPVPRSSSHGSSDVQTNFSTVPVSHLFSLDSHGSHVASAPLLPRFQSTFIPGNSEFPLSVYSRLYLPPKKYMKSPTGFVFASRRIPLGCLGRSYGSLLWFAPHSGFFAHPSVWFTHS